MGKDLRNNMKPVPDNVEHLLNEAQLSALHGIKQLGWELHFVRRPLFQDPVPVLINRKGDKTIVLEANGTINEFADIDTRECISADEMLKSMTG